MRHLRKQSYWHTPLSAATCGIRIDRVGSFYETTAARTRHCPFILFANSKEALEKLDVRKLGDGGNIAKLVGVTSC